MTLASNSTAFSHTALPIFVLLHLTVTSSAELPANKVLELVLLIMDPGSMHGFQFLQLCWVLTVCKALHFDGAFIILQGPLSEAWDTQAHNIKIVN